MYLLNCCVVIELTKRKTRANNAGAYSDSLALDALMRLGGLKCLCRERLARLGGEPYSVLLKLIYPPSWLTLLTKPSFFFSHVNCSPSFEGNVGKVVLPRVARVGEWPFNPWHAFLRIIEASFFPFVVKGLSEWGALIICFCLVFQRWQQTKAEYSNCFGWKSTNYIPGKYLSTVN